MKIILGKIYLGCTKLNSLRRRKFQIECIKAELESVNSAAVQRYNKIFMASEIDYKAIVQEGGSMSIPSWTLIL